MSFPKRVVPVLNPYTKHPVQLHAKTTATTHEHNKPPSTTVVNTTTSSTASALIIAASDKAGIPVDRTHIDAIILRESANSLYFQQQQARDHKVNQKIERLHDKLTQETRNNPNWKQQYQQVVDAEIPDLLRARSKRSTAVVVDMDMFYMACELQTRPELAHVPACVGTTMILTSNYEARKYGVRSAMAGWIGDALVQELSSHQQSLVHVPAHFDLYRNKSNLVRTVLAEYDPNLRAYSLDEAYLDLAPYLVYRFQGWTHEKIVERLQKQQEEHESASKDSAVENTLQDDDDDDEVGSKSALADVALQAYTPNVCAQLADQVVSEMRHQVAMATGGLTCSAGIAPNFMLAKIASDHNKPNGQLVVGSAHDDIVHFLYPLPPRKVGGIGRVTDKVLNAFGIRTVRDMYEERALIRLLFQPATAAFLLRASLGCSSSTTSASEEDSSSTGQKGISRERTFPSGRPWAEINSRLEDIGRLLSDDMKRKDIWAHTMTVKVKLHTFDCLSKSKSLPAGVFIQDGKDLVGLASELLRSIRKDFESSVFSVRLLGIRCSNFRTKDEPLSAQKMDISKFLEEKPVSNGIGPQRGSRTSIVKFLVKKGAASPVRDLMLSSDPASTASKHNEVVTALGVQKADSFVPTVLPSASPAVEAAGLESQAPESLSAAVILHCPLCGAGFSEEANDQLNHHIDACLNSSVVRGAVREANQLQSHKPIRRKRRLDDFFRSSSGTK